MTPPPMSPRSAGSDGRILRVLFYNHSGDVSGAEISLLLTIQHLHDVEATLAAPEGELLERARAADINTVPVQSHRARMSRNPIQILRGLIGTMLTGLRLRRIIRQHRPDVIHANSIRAGLIVVVGVLGVKIPVLWHVRDNLARNFVGRAIRGLAGKRVASVFAISNAIAVNFSSTSKLHGKTKVVYNGIQTDLPVTTTNLREELQTRDDAFVIGVVGQIALWKRQADALTAFSRFHQNVGNTEMWVVGSPKFREENVAYFEDLKALAKRAGIEEKVRFLGYREDIPNVMQAIDVLLVPSENEPFGRVVIEAMLAGKPVIGTRGGGIPEIVRDGETGFLVNIGDTKAMQLLLYWICRSKDLQRMLGENGRARCVNQFSIEKTCEAIQQVYERVTQSGERRKWHVEEAESSIGGQ